ncbi:DUF5011 domain-containing protein [Paenibacillus oenotherae]|uniref:DUF5011 domain-containing protein n=1 Tax=Paenibacillus oenotherae TaxID=1435645 RepID=A0ABS7D3E5_9BACL|nr:DUF5011 domain-containing protein [Paenibacillus oenotherae]MBW7474449.1 DUF5011 domain-containing protein [Paenibacillus oenotherae]
MKDSLFLGKRPARLLRSWMALTGAAYLLGGLYGLVPVHGEGAPSVSAAVHEELVAADSAGKMKESNQGRDKTAPVMTLIGVNPMTVEWGSLYVDPGAAAFDEVDGSVAVQVSGVVRTNEAGTYTLTYSATDASGNTIVNKRNVRVMEQSAYPLHPDSRGMVPVLDNVSLVKGMEPSGGRWGVGRCRDEDFMRESGTAASLDVKDTTAPVLTLTGVNPMTVEGGGMYVEPGAEAWDEVDGCVAVTVKGSVNTKAPGRYTLTYSASDASNNTVTVTRIVQVMDMAAPHIMLVGPNFLKVEAGSRFVDPGAFAYDRMDGSVAVRVRGKVNTKVAGTYTLTYSAMDRSGNTATATRAVRVAASYTSAKQ